MSVSSYLSLADLKPGEHAQIIRLHEENRTAFKHLVSMGILPKIKLELIRNKPVYVFSLGNARFALDKELAKLIEVKKI